MVFEFKPFWKCLDCGQMGDAKINIPVKCPKCNSENIRRPAVKKGGPFDPDSLKKY